jgi:hypothetical protein
MCDLDSKNGEDAALSFTKEYGKGRIMFIKADVTKEKDLEGLLNTLVFSAVKTLCFSAHLSNRFFKSF